MADVKFTEDHEWIALRGVSVRSAYGFRPRTAWRYRLYRIAGSRRDLGKGQQAGVVESVKAASEIYTPVTGEITEANEALVNAPDTVNAEAESGGWFFKIKVSNMSELKASCTRPRTRPSSPRFADRKDLRRARFRATAIRPEQTDDFVTRHVGRAMMTSRTCCGRSA